MPGHAPLGNRTLGDGGADLPVVTITSPTNEQVIGSGGPNLTVTWTYTHALAVVQAMYRVVLSNDAGTVTYYDSGWLTGAGTSHTVDLVARGVPVDTTDISVRVGVRPETATPFNSYDGEVETARRPFQLQWGVVTCDITFPEDKGFVFTASVTPTWTYNSTRSKAQGLYRVRLRISAVVLYDSGWVVGAATSFLVPFPLVEGVAYNLDVELKNTEGVSSGVETLVFTTYQIDPATYPDEPTVGSVYEVAINGMGYMLFDDHPEYPDIKRQRGTIPLDSPRLVTSDTPFSESIERYGLQGFADLSDGAGQVSLNREHSSPSAFLDSQGVDPFTVRGEVRLLNAVAEEHNSAYTNQLMAVVGDDLYILTGAKQLTRKTTPGGGTSNLSIAAATTVVDLASDGQAWYAAAGTAGIFKGTTADPGAKWDTLTAGTDVRVVGFGAERVCAAYVGTSSSTPNVFTTFTAGGAEESAGGRKTLPVGWTITDIIDGEGYVYFSAYSGGVGRIYKWQSGSTDAPTLAASFPPGERPMALYHRQGQVFVRVKRAHGSGANGIVYRGVQAEDGKLELFNVVTLGDSEPSVDWSVGGFSSLGNLVFFSWKAMDGTNAGVGAIDLTTGGYTKWFQASEAGDVAAIVIWQDHVTFSVNTGGVFRQNHNYVTSGWLKTSFVDGGSSLKKTWDQLIVHAKPVGTGESITVDYAIDGSTVYNPTGAELFTTSLAQLTFPFHKTSTSLSLRVNLVGDGTTSPTLRITQVQFHAAEIADTVLTLPIDCGDVVADLRGYPLAENGPGAGALRYTFLESLARTQVKVQDVTWPWTQTPEIYEVYDIRQLLTKSGYDRNQGKNTMHLVAVITLRKVAS